MPYIQLKIDNEKINKEIELFKIENNLETKQEAILLMMQEYINKFRNKK